MDAPRTFALLNDKKPAFDEPLPVGQLYVPDWSEFETAMRGIFDRRYYTNHGPILQQLEEALSDFLQVRHAICVTNATIGLLMAADALGLSGSVIVPSHTFVATSQSLLWNGLRPLFCDVDPVTQQIDPDLASQLIGKDVSAILGVHLWGGACDVHRLQELCDNNGLKLYFDSAHAFGCSVVGRPIGGFGQLEVFSFHSTKVMSSTEGGCVTTNDDKIATRLRNIRSSYGARTATAVPKTSNGRMSELQAAMALISLRDHEMICARNKKLFKAYDMGLEEIPGIRLKHPFNVDRSNYQYAACEVDVKLFGMSRDLLMKFLHAENIIARRYFYPGTHKTIDFINSKDRGAYHLPVTDHLSETGLQLPLGSRVDGFSVERICEIIAAIQKSATGLSATYNKKHRCV
jgi:dTDP-4-amino-4,6-dideoxygalactose transaminase